MNEREPCQRVAAIRREEYAPFEHQKHVFLTGDLQRPNSHPFFRDTRLEWIMCFYEPGDDGLPHWHQDVTEYETVLEGEIGYFEAATGETKWFREGDFIAIPAGVCVKRMVRERARTLAVKVPSNAQRATCSCCQRECTSRISPFVEVMRTECG
jgi:quercetin dioxygenase-like cupin family protein